MNHKQLSEAATKAKQHSFSPYSNFRVGSALLTKSGKLYTGCNVEISTYSLTICAERTAIFKAYSEGERSIVAIAIASDEPGFTSPCGACRQVIYELGGNIDIILTNKSGKRKIFKTKDLLPHAFSSKNLK